MSTVIDTPTYHVAIDDSMNVIGSQLLNVSIVAVLSPGAGVTTVRVPWLEVIGETPITPLVFTPIRDGQYAVDVTEGAVTARLPLHPSDGYEFKWRDIGSNFGVDHSFFIEAEAGATYKIDGVLASEPNSTLEVDVPNFGGSLYFSERLNNWSLSEIGLPTNLPPPGMVFTFRGQTQPVVDSGVPYIWYKTDATGTVIDILQGIGD